MRLLRSILAVIAGYLVFAISAALLFQLSGRNAHAPQRMGFMLVTIVYGMLFAALGGLLTNRIAPARPRLHGAMLAGLIALGAAVSLITSPRTDATWSQWAALLLMAPSAYLATRLAAWRIDL